MNHRTLPICLSLVFLFAGLVLNLPHGLAQNDTSPNIVLILCDDLGYGDVQCLNPENGKIPTPCMDRIAESGMTFTDAHSGSSVCTPTRYGLLTGRYSWRTKLQSGVVQGFAPCLIDEGRPTLASFLRDAGYQTAILGKWHLDFQYQDPETGEIIEDGKPLKYTPPVGATIPDGPLTRGFDYFHGTHHARSMKTIIENDRVTEYDDPVNFLPRLRESSVRYIRENSGGDKPFFLYVPLGSPHTPILPTAEWQGKSGLNPYCDFVMQTDDVIGQIHKTIEEAGIAENTIVIVASDNGCSRQAKIKQLADRGHRVSADLRGSKSDIWEGGHRIPFFVSWPGKIDAGTRSDQTICMTDIFATIGEMIEKEVPENSCQDSVSFVPALNGEPIVTERKGIIHHSISGHFAYRQGDWKLILARGSGGWSGPTENKVPADAPRAQLYNMVSDLGEQENQFEQQPEIAEQLLQQLTEYVENGRSAPGVDSPNDEGVGIELWKTRER